MSSFNATFRNNLRQAALVRSQHEDVLHNYIYDLDTEVASWLLSLSDAAIQKLLDRSTSDYLIQAGYVATAKGKKYLYSKSGSSKQDFPNKVFTIVLTDTAEEFENSVFKTQLISEARDLQGKPWYFRGIKRDPKAIAYFNDRMKAIVLDLLTRD